MINQALTKMSSINTRISLHMSERLGAVVTDAGRDDSATYTIAVTDNPACCATITSGTIASQTLVKFNAFASSGDAAVASGVKATTVRGIAKDTPALL